jgi:hypothetical protein
MAPLDGISFACQLMRGARRGLGMGNRAAYAYTSIEGIST